MLSSREVSAALSAELTAAMTMSCSISTSSGSTASGSIVSVMSSRLPLTSAVTTPPPAEAEYVLASSSSCIFSMSCCIFCACFIRSLCLMPPPILIPPPKLPPLYPFAIVSCLLFIGWLHCRICRENQVYPPPVRRRFAAPPAGSASVRRRAQTPSAVSC